MPTTTVPDSAPGAALARIQLAAAVSCALVITGLYTIPFFRVLSSIGQGCLLLCALAYWYQARQAAQRAKWPVYLGFGLIFLMHLAAGLITSTANAKEFWRDIVLQLPFLLLPLAFWLLPALPVRSMQRLYLLLIGLTTVSALGSTVNYLLDARRINELYIHSKIMPTVPDHIRFSLLVVLSVAVGAILLNRQVLSGALRTAVLAAVVFLVFFAHLLAVRSGLVALYALAVVGIGYLLRRRAFGPAAAVAGLLVVLPVLSYFTLPTFYNKFHNTKEDARRVEQTQSANNYSLVGRVYSYQAAVQVWKENIVVGVGKADLRDAMAVRYRRLFPRIEEKHYLQPHNQYLVYMVSFGTLGLLLFLAGFYYPLLWALRRPVPILLAQYLIVTLSFMVEPTLEGQTGITFALFFLLLALSSAWAAPRAGEAAVPRGPQWRPA